MDKVVKPVVVTARVNMILRDIDNAAAGLYPEVRPDSIGRDATAPTIAVRPVDQVM